ncbi:MAG: hypothetical protein U5R48_12100 [Gammaproteobacteria bacterium]|nr:hypothetical protein [Gammaproteobacteria bacterium]
MDGSVTDDLPAKRLSRLYGVNHFITSMINPIVLWSVRDPDMEGSLLHRFWDIYQKAGKEFLRATYPLAMQTVRRAYPLNLVVRMGYAVATQDYTGDITILPKQKLHNPTKLLAVLSGQGRAILEDLGGRAVRTSASPTRPEPGRAAEPRAARRRLVAPPECRSPHEPGRRDVPAPVEAGPFERPRRPAAGSADAPAQLSDRCRSPSVGSGTALVTDRQLRRTARPRWRSR